ncbi:hypothetical protein SAMN05216344_11113 [Polaromonas sp. OV174]|uniref:hypothetical protein n=1 Tax=Polaromonas sp. OV174 TaxID=1855300 RepID=UPI0008E7154F|nr:hypothetical protein [Polaromonas sp. OV174]SFC19625.1 hypothetical protein SAMN05216344_11113 [Polaromonas sp. OV174]
MNQKTNFSFEVQYPAGSDSNQAQRDAVMAALGPALQQLLKAQDSAATVMVSDSHRGSDNKLVELSTTLQDPQIADILKTFAAQHGVLVSAFE